MSTVLNSQTALIFGSGRVADDAGGAGAVEVIGAAGGSWSSVSTTTWSVVDSGSSDSSTTGWMESSGSSDSSTRGGVAGAQLSSAKVLVTVLVHVSSSVKTSLVNISRL